MALTSQHFDGYCLGSTASRYA